ncbi:MAG: PASTA domain-containing protein [Ignavibacteriales bacterium]|nr:PASTA domain-containing protein [Ignavibacteriales bacterium]
MTLRPVFLSLLKGTAILAAAFLALFFVLDDVLMPRYVQQGETTNVPNVVGAGVDEALNILADVGLEGKKAEIRPDKRFPEGAVVVQTPPAGSVVKFGRGVYLTVSGGETLVTVPALRGRSLRDATLALERYGLKLGEVQYKVSLQFPENTIIDQSVAESTKVRGGTTISVVASQGPSADRVPVPNLVRKSLAETERILLQAGLVVGNITYQVNNEMLPNTVIDQYPRPGAFAASGQAIELFITQRGEKKVLEN